MSRRAASSSSTSTQKLGVLHCWCNKPCVVKTSGTELNPGRQFYGCRSLPVAIDEGEHKSSIEVRLGFHSRITSLNSEIPPKHTEEKKPRRTRPKLSVG
ncbi:unnamed protein product [Linum trigynum]|uniref:Zinc finger GRF-type domain-containing protein n=1 Tax=Linum trigynum TaxID=586398 RepID=A0AAV2GA02_9ROSI